MSKQLNIDVNLNTAKASAQLKALQQMLQEAINSSTSKGTLTREIVQATEAATKLKSILNSSMNSKGNLDLSKFSANLKASGTNLTQYAQQLNNLGTTGQQAFMSMAKQITTAQAPLKQTNTLTQSLFTSLKNTARWQLSSAMLHGVINTFHNAFSYARGLNESLNSIRIVTGLSADEMNRFAESANKSAKALSASTLDYTDAALIYYQQGIRDQKQIKERTDATIKMANVTGDSAAKVSNQLTAIWNNFDKGGQNLEYYADVITALGAATASSSSEISAGLEKFASIAEETGLSYEYATSSLATIVATTRQSADVVGTALKTIFGRVQSLNLGETLEDGTTLGKYSKALEKVGINIKDQNGQLKDMDVILDEMGGKWETLNRDQKVAMAQAVAGARQYNQLMALMENYDFFKENVKIARGSKGTLEEQQEIYAESWQAARDRVKASWQGILDDVISDDFFIGLNNGFAGLLSGVNKFIDTIGGIPGTLGLVGAAFMKLFQNPINKGISNLTTSIKTLKKDYVKEQSALQNQVVSAVGAITPRKDSPQSNIMQVNNLKQSVSLSNAYAQKMQAIANMGMTISNADRTRVASLQELVNFYGELEVRAQQMVEQEQAATEAVQARIAAQAEARAISSTTGSQGTKIMAGVRAKEESENLTNAAVQSYRTALMGQAGLKAIGNGFTLSSDMRTSLGAFANQALGRISPTIQTPLTYEDFISRYGFRINGKNLPKNVNPRALFTQFTTGTLDKKYEVWEKGEKRGAVTPFTNRYMGSYSDMVNQSSNPAYAAAQRGANFFASNRFDRVAQHIADAYKAGVYDKPFEELTKQEQKLYNRAQNAQSYIDKQANALDLKGAEKYIASSVVAAAGNGKQGAELRESVTREVNAQYEKNAVGQIKNKSAAELAKTINAMDPEKINKGFANAAMGVANVAMGVSSLTAGFKALTNESLTFGEKLLQTSMSFGMGISMMTMGMPGLTKALRGITKGFSALGALIAGQKLGTLFAADGLFGGAIQSLKGALPAILAITAVVGTIAAIKAANKAAFEASPEGQLKTAQQHATDMQTALEQTKSAAESLSASFDNYDSVASNLKSCVKGTQEWTEALRQNNNEVVNMLAKYPQLAAMENVIKKDGDGVLSFSKEGREALQKQMEQNVRAAEWASAQAAQDVIDKKSLVQQRALGKDFKNLTDYQDSIYTLPLPSIRMGQGNQEIERYSERRLGQSNTKFLDDIALDIANTYDKSGTKKAIEAARHSADQQNVNDYAAGLKQGAEPFIKAAKQQQEFSKAQDELNSQRINDYKIAAKEEARAAQDAREKRQDLIYLRNQSIKEEQQDYIANKKEEAENIKRNKEIRKKIEQEEIEQRKKEYKNSALGRDREKSRKELLDTIDNVFDIFKDTSGAIDNARKDALQTVSNENVKGQSLGKTIESMINSVEDTYTQNYQERRMGNTAKQVNLAGVEALGNTQAPILGGLHDREMLNANEIPIRKDALQMISGDMVAESYHERADKSINGLFNKFQDPKEAGLNIIAEHWDQLMGLTVDEMGPVLDKVFQGTGISMVDSSAWAKELTTNSDLRAALNENAASMMAAQTAQAAQEASTINEELIAQGYSKTDAETISNMMGQQGKLSELTKSESERIDRELRKKDTNARDLAKQYVASLGGMESSVDWEKGGIKYKDASGADQTATWEMMSSALGAAAALEQLGASAADAASFLATLNSGEMPEDTAKGIQEYLEHGNFLDMTPEELAKQTTQSAKDIAQSIRDTGMDEDAFKEMTGKDIDQFAEEMVNSAKGNAEAWNTFVSNLTESQKQEIEGLNNYSKMSAADIMDYYDNHFKPKDIDLSNERRSYEDLKENVDGIRESWDAVGDSIKDGAHVTTELQGLFDELGANTGDLGQYIEGDLITDAEGLKAYLDSLNDSLVQDIEHAKQLDMIGYNNIIAEMGSLNLETEEGRTKFEQLKEAAESFKDSISNLSLLQAQLSGVTEGFNNFQKAIEADKASDYTDDLASSISTFMEVSGKGQINSDTYKTGLELLVPEDYQTDRSTAEGYIRDVLGQYFTRDSSGNISVESGDIDNFLAQALKNGALTGTADNFSLAEGIDSVETFADKMNLTKEAAFALMEALSKTSEQGSEMFTTMMQNSDDATYKMMGVNQELQTLYEKKEQAIKDGNWTLVAEIDGNIEEKLGELEKFKKEAEDTVTTYWEVKQKKEKALDKVEQLKEELAGVQDANNNGLDDKDVNPKTGRTKVQIEADLTKAQEQVTDFANKLDGMKPSEIGVRLKLESMEEQKSQIKSKISEIEQEIANSTTKIDENGKEIEVTAHYGTVEEAANEVQHLNDTLNSVTTQQKSIAVEFHAEGVLDEITNISDELGDVPPNTQAKVSAPGAKQAAGDVRSLNTELGRVRSTSATVTVTVHEDHIKTTTEYVNQIKGKYPGGGTFYSGSSFAKGSAFATGHLQTVGAAGQGALVGELGTELVVDPHSGMYYTVGDNGAEIVNMPKDAIIFNHKQTENLLKYKRINSRGQAYAYGSAFGMKHESAHDPWASSSGSSGGSSGSSGSSSGSSGSSSSSSGSGGKKKKGGAAAASNGEILTYEEQLLNIIRDEVDEYANLERSITRLEHAYKNFTRNNDRLWGKALLENIQKSIDQGKKLYEAEYAKLEKRKDDYAKSTARLNSTNELQYQQKVLVGGTYAKDPKYNTQLITFQDFKGMDFLTGLGLLDESALQRGANGEVTGVNDVVAVDRAIEEYLRQKGIEANTLRTSKPGEEGEVAAENLMNNANAIAELLNKLLKEYTDSEADMLEQEEKTQDILEEIHDLAAQRITQEMEMRVQLQDNEKKLIDFAVKRIGDNPFRQAEKFIKQFKPSLFEDVPLRENGVIGTLIKKMDASIDAWNKANNQLALGQKDPHDKDAISLANWQDITQKSFDEVMNDLNELVDFINDMAEAFSKTAELGMAEIEKYTGRMEHTVSVLDHMGKLLDLTGRKYDYASRKTIIEGSMHNLENAWKEAEHWADLMTQQREASEQTYQELLTTDAEGAEWYKQNVLDKSYELEQDALEKMYTAAEDYMTKVEELWDVGLEEIMANWEEAATNGNGFDFLSDSMSKAKSIQEEYLTTTNKLYETNTLMRKVQQNIDKTDSKISKEKLASFNQEIKAAQEKNQLSVVEMEILKARYDLLEAQLALEEARDAKSIVRLQRDSEGNYGYVYTADQDDIDEKEQEVADKENDLYNLVLGYYNENQEKRVQVMQEYNAAAEQLYRDWHDRHLMSEDEYKAKLAELYDKANKKLLAIDENLAHSEKWLNITAATDVSEAWSHSFDDRIASTDRYMESFTKANEDTEKLMNKIDGIRDTVTKNAKLGLDDVTKKTDELTKKNDELAKQAEITSNKVADEMRAVDGLTASLAAQYTELQSLITAYYQYAQAMQAAMIEKGPEEAPSIMDTNWAAKDLEDRFNGTYNKDTLQVNREIARDYRKNQTWTANAGTREAINDFVFNEASGAIGIGGVTETSARKAAQTAGTLLEQASIVYGVDMTGWNHSQVDSFWKEKNLGDSNVVKNIEDRYNEIKKAATGATGMYTGEWGSEGKLAILHEKELVLNKDDTSNFLHALTIAKSNYEQMIQLQDLQSQYRSALFDSISNNIAAMFNKPSDTLQQEVTIHAEFPNATDHSEIEEAFSNLVNRAAQYASQSGWARDYENIVR